MLAPRSGETIELKSITVLITQYCALCLRINNIICVAIYLRQSELFNGKGKSLPSIGFFILQAKSKKN